MLVNRYGNDKRDVYRWWSKHGRAPARRIDPVLLVYNLNTEEGERFTFRSLAVSRINRFCWSRWNWIKNLNVKRNQYLQFHTSRKGKKNIWLSGRDYTVAWRNLFVLYLGNKFIGWNFKKGTKGESMKKRLSKNRNVKSTNGKHFIKRVFKY